MSRRVRALGNRNFPWTSLDPDRRNAVLLLGGIGIVIVLALGLIGYGYYSDRIAPKHDTVLKVGDRNFDYALVERRARAELVRGRIDTSKLGDSLYAVVVTIQREEILRQAAVTIGLTVSGDEIEARYAVRLALQKEASRELLASRLRDDLLRTGLSLSEYRDITEAEVLERKMRDQFESKVPAEAEFVDLRLIESRTQAEALKAKERLDRGEKFSLVAVDVSIDPSGKTNAGDLSWTPRGALQKQVEEVAFSLAAGSRSDVIEADEGFFIVESAGKETRAVNSDAKNTIVQRSIADLLGETRKRIGTEITMTTRQIQKLASSVSAPVG